VPAAAHPIKVSLCDPQHRSGNPGGYQYTGFTPAYYPAGPGGYFYPTVYSRTYYQPPVSPSAFLAIDYVNVTTKPMATIEFGLIANRNLVAMVRDVGTFSPGAEIKHQFGISPNVFPISTGLPHCVPLRITYKDGTTWKNPRLPDDNPGIYLRKHN